MNILVLCGDVSPPSPWLEALRERFAEAGIFVVEDAAQAMDIMRSGVAIRAVIIGLALGAEELIGLAERLCVEGRAVTLPWIIAHRDGADDAVALRAFRLRGVNALTEQAQIIDGLHRTLAIEAGVTPAEARRDVPVPAPARTSAGHDARTPAGAELASGPGGANGESRLTPRQTEVLALVNEGKSNKEIGRELQLSEGTVKVHCKAIFRALGVANRTQAAVLIAKAGFLSREVNE